jgi:hypothetical protein
VLPLATSVDGRRFRFQTTLDGLELKGGGYVRLDDGGSTRLGQVLSLELHTEDAAGPGCRRCASASRAATGWCC